MNAQTNHPINNTTNALFLGPEAGQQAEGKGQAELDANGTELYRYFSTARGELMSIRSNGTTFRRRFGCDWAFFARKKPDVELSQWVAAKEARRQTLASWQLEVEDLPTMEELQEWVDDGVCHTPTGHRTEPDGEGPDGVPSWLRVLGLI